ncbi:Transcriptional regulatory protein YpdB [bioreactor metagenome]|uniref:Transcriptional regulatory protein YpdB n=1 Tax=bioreactor metagenome TaxID=1076179 RepID=A0A645E7J0_9ZZZZ|nr:LytTR family DNA-binding domain-containing protein [Candidatus Pelethousia sp.]
MKEELHIGVCEDEGAAAQHLLSCIEESGIPAHCVAFTSSEELLAEFRQGLYDILFIDIYLTGMTGVEAAAKIREVDEDTMMAFTTSSTDHTLESYRLGALKYLEKPVKAKDVRETLELALLKRKTRRYLSLLIGGGLKDIPVNTILYFEQRDHAVMVHTTAGVYRTSQRVKLSDIEEKVPFASFLRCHRSYIVNLHYVMELNKELRVFSMKNGDKVYIRRQSLKAASDAFEAYLFQTAREDA